MSGWDQQFDLEEHNTFIEGEVLDVRLAPQRMLEWLGVFAGIVGVVILLGIAVLVWQVAL